MFFFLQINTTFHESNFSTNNSCCIGYDMISFHLIHDVSFLFYIHPIFKFIFCVTRYSQHNTHSSILRVCSEIHYCSFSLFPSAFSTLFFFFFSFHSSRKQIALFTTPKWKHVSEHLVLSHTPKKETFNMLVVSFYYPFLFFAFERM